MATLGAKVDGHGPVSEVSGSVVNVFVNFEEDNEGIVISGPIVQESPEKEFELVSEHSNKRGRSCLRISLLVGAFALAALGGAGIAFGFPFLPDEQGDGQSDRGIGAKDRVRRASVAGSLTLRSLGEGTAVSPGDERLHSAVAQVLASLLQGVHADAIQVHVATGRVAPAPLLRGGGRQLAEEFIFLGYVVGLNGPGSPTPEVAGQLLRGADVEALSMELAVQMASQDLPIEDRFEVVSMTASSPSVDLPRGPDSQHSHWNHTESNEEVEVGWTSTEDGSSTTHQRDRNADVGLLSSAEGNEFSPQGHGEDSWSSRDAGQQDREEHEGSDSAAHHTRRGAE